MGKNQYGSYVVIGVIAAAVCLFVMKIDSIAAGILLAADAASPLFLGCVIAYVLNILLKRLERFYFPKTKNKTLIKTRRPVCIALSFVVLAVILALVAALVVPELLSSVRLIADEVPSTIEEIRLWGIAHSDQMPAIQEYLVGLDVDWQAMMKKAMDILAAGAGGLLSSVVTVFSKIFGTATKLLIGSIFAIYLLSAKETLCGQADRFLRAYMKPGTRRRILYVAETLHDTFTNFIVGQCMEAVIIGTLCALGMTILRMPYAVMTGAVVGVTALIPVVGAYIGAVVGAFMVFTVNPLQAVGFVVFLVILQQLEGNLIYPRVVGSSIGLPGLWVLAAVTVGGGVLGVTGMLLGVPLAASAYRLLGADVRARLTDVSYKEKDRKARKESNGRKQGSAGRKLPRQKPQTAEKTGE